MKRSIIILFFMSCAALSFGQQQASFTQYMFNGMSINPGYIGTHEALSLTALSRWQWAGVEGAPSTKTFAAHSPIPGKNAGVGLQVMNDQIAITNTTSVMAGFSYRMQVGINGYLSMGLQGGFQNIQNRYSEVYTMGLDPTFQQNYTSMMPNFGTGLFYYNPVWYVGASVPMLLNNKVEVEGNDMYTQKRHYFYTAGMAISASRNVLLKPNVLVKMVDGAPLSIDYNLNVLFNEIIWVGISVRPPESISFLTEINVTNKLRVGFAYDYVIDETLSDFAGASQEILLGYRIPWNKNGTSNLQIF
ncbi:PorP/SprF family type IX secretion system membrane protein [Ekhidna sp.]|uniref:PorP/SprF family type IX secretion system membrane protein n=1 Tax=Ekhidna sp. TaxID=2608089 RepID=UPI003CCBBDB4